MIHWSPIRSPLSHPARGAWIEIRRAADEPAACHRRTPQGVRGLKSLRRYIANLDDMSHPARGAWIEIDTYSLLPVFEEVAPRKGCVD